MRRQRVAAPPRSESSTSETSSSTEPVVSQREGNAAAQESLPGVQAEESLLLDGPAEQAGPAADPAADQDDFSVAFNREFASVLHVFGSDALTAASSGPDTTSATVGQASGPPVAASELRELFTPNQRRLLLEFCTNHRIPDYLFNGDEVGATTAQQRLLMSGHILTIGEYTPGSFSQRVHARMCGHWVNLVHSYAGVGNAGTGGGVREQFDHEGHLALSVSTREETTEEGETETHTGSARRDGVYNGRRIRDEEYATRADARPERSQFQMEGLPLAQLNGQLRAGDWLWFYNDNGGAGGNHSVIFSRWASEERVTPGPNGVPYRRAICMSQLSPSEGGREHTALLGDRFVRNEEGHRITPVVHIERVAEDTRPVRTLDELMAVLGSGSEATDNQRFIEHLEEQRGGHADMGELLRDIRRRNEGLITQLDGAGRLTEDQNRLFLEANGGDQLGPLIRLHERLQAWSANSTALAEGEASQRATVEERHRDADERTAPRRAELESELQAIDEGIEQLDRERQDAERRAGELDVRGDLARARSELRGLRQDRRGLRARQRAARTEEDERAVATEIAALDTRISTAVERVAELLEMSRGPGRREAQREARQAAGAIRRENAHRQRVEGELRQLGGAAGYFTAHWGNRDRFNGRGEARRTTGLLRNLDPQPDWGRIIRSGS